MVNAYPIPSFDILIENIIDAIMEVIVFEFLEMAAGVGSREELAAEVGKGFHRATHIHEQKQLHRIFPAFSPDKLQLAGVLAGGVYGVFQVQFFRAYAVQLAQLCQGYFDLADIQSQVMAVVAESPGLSDFDSASSTCRRRQS